MSEHIPVFIYTFLACLSFCVIFKFHKIPHITLNLTTIILQFPF